MSATPSVKPEWTDRARLLLVLSRGVPARIRHLAQDLKSLLPHVHAEPKFPKKESVEVLNEVAALAKCQRILYIEARSQIDCYMWLSSDISAGPSAKFLLHNVHTMAELSLIGNCLKGTRAILSFDARFDKEPHFALVKKMLVDVFHVPKNHPRSKPFFDHVMSFGITPDGRIWVRVYSYPALEEIGPRFVLQVSRIFNGSFGGEVLYSNPDFINPRAIRRQKRLELAAQSRAKMIQKEKAVKHQLKLKKVKRPDRLGEIFNEEINDPEAKKLLEQIDQDSNNDE